MEKDLEEGVFYFYCGNCSTGHGLGQGKVDDTTPEQRARMTKYALGMFMMCECDEDGETPAAAAQANVNIAQQGTHSVAVNVSGDMDAPTKKAIVDSVRERKRGQLNTKQNRNRI